MKDNYAIQLLQQEKRNLIDRLVDLEVLEYEGKEVNEMIRPLYKKQLSDIEHVLKLLDLQTKGDEKNVKVYIG